MSYFERENGYESDYERMMDTGGFTKTDNWGHQHNALAYENELQEGVHEHIAYNPKTGKSIWHGKYYPTKHNSVHNEAYIGQIEKQEGEFIAEKYNSWDGLSDSQKKLMEAIDQSKDIEQLKEIRRILLESEEDSQDVKKLTLKMRR